MHMTAGVPKGYEPDAHLLSEARRIAQDTAARIEVVHDPFEAVRNADVLYTDVWVSMGREKEREERERLFLPFQVNEKLVRAANPDTVVMHCLPAHRGLEITDEVVDGPHSIVFDQAENRLHAQKAILARFLAGL